MKRIRRISGLCAALLLLSACADGSAAEQTAQPAGTAEQTLPETEAAPAAVTVAADGVTEFTVVRADNASAAVITDAKTLRNRLGKALGATFQIGNDWTKPGDTSAATAKEILVGPCNRAESEAFFASLAPGEYGFRVSGCKIVIGGSDDGLTALALKAFEDQVIYSMEYRKGGTLTVPDGLTMTYKNGSDFSGTHVLSLSQTVVAVEGEVVCTVPKQEGYTAAQGSASDGTYFYSILIGTRADGSQTGIIVKSPMDDNDKKKKQYSADLPLDHANDMCYNPKENVLVITNMKGKLLTVVDPETLTVIRQVDATWFGGTPWAISYNAKRDCYVVAAGGYLNILDETFHSKAPGIPIHGETGYTGQGMDCDDDYLFMPFSPGQSTKDNVISVYTWDGGYQRTVHLDKSIESETLINVDGEYFICYNSGGVRITRLSYCVIYD